MMKNPKNFAQTPVFDDLDALSEVLGSVRFIGGRIREHSSSTPPEPTFANGERSLLIVRKGTVLFQCEDAGDKAIELHSRDIVLLAFGSSFSMAYPPQTNSVGFSDRNDGVSEKTCEWICGTFHIDERLSRRFLSSLPKVMILREIPNDAMDWLEVASTFALAEVQAREPGGAVMISRIIELLLIRVLRLWALDTAAEASWLVGANDPAIGRALGAMHVGPDRDWSVPELARIAGLSRSVFAARFATLVGQTPVKYLLGLRLDKAADSLRMTKLTIAEISDSIGYSSEAAFSRAFKIRFGCSPSVWRRI